jgi:type IV pilus assembly protein PilO
MTVMIDNALAKKAQGASETTRSLLTKLNLYYAGVAVLAIVNLYLLIQIALAWSAAHRQDENALAQQRVAMKTAEIAKKPLEGLDGKLVSATEQADSFYQKRLPYAYSQVAGELGVLKNKYNVKLIRIQYAEAPVLASGTGPMTEVRMDASLSGDYRPLVLFINALERDKMFFLIRGVTLTGQQSGTVGLRLALTTYLRAPAGTEGSEKSAAAANDATATGSVPQ